MGKHEEAHKEHINKYKMAHMIGVAEYMRERASDYNKGYYKDPTTFCREPVPIQIDPEEAYVVGLLHDIGYIYERKDHEAKGADLLLKMGMNHNLAYAIQEHGTNPYEILEERKGRALGMDAISPILALLYEADMSVNAQGYRVGFDKRAEDILTRLEGTEFYDDAKKNVTDTIRFVKEWQREHGISKPSKEFWKHQQQPEETR